jgi:hypothetical protein
LAHSEGLPAFPEIDSEEKLRAVGTAFINRAEAQAARPFESHRGAHGKREPGGKNHVAAGSRLDHRGTAAIPAPEQNQGDFLIPVENNVRR